MERALGIELRKLSNLTCRYFDQQTNKRAVDAVTGTNGWIIGYIARREKEAFSGTKKTDCRWFPCWQKQDMQSRLSEKKFPEANIENQLSTNT